MRDVARPACVGLAHALERHLAPVHEAAELADLPLHVVDALGPHLSDHLAGAREIGVEAEEVDAVLEREDLRLAVQAQAQRLDVLLDPLEDLPEQQLVAADDVEVIHVTAIDEAEVIPQPVVEVVQIEQGEQLARLVADGDPGVWRAVDDDPEQPLDEVDQLLVRQEGQSLAGLLEADGVQQGRALRPVSQLPLLRVGQEQVVGLHQVGDEVAGLVHHPLCQPEPFLLGEDVRVARLDVGVLLELLGVADDLHLRELFTAEGRAAYIGPLVWPRVSVACRSTSPPPL